MKLCKVSTTDASGKRHTIEVEAESVYRAILLCNTHATCHPAYGLPKPTDETVFEVQIDGKADTRAFHQTREWSPAQLVGTDAEYAASQAALLESTPQ
jgi:hypothetical protein